MQQRDVNFVLFVNSISGGNIGRDYLTLADEPLSFKMQNEVMVTVHLYDMLDPSSRKDGIRLIRDTHQTLDTYIIVCGGDGTVLWVVEEVADAQIDINKVVFGIIPIGTGNDFSRTLGWGSVPTPFSKKKPGKLKKLVQEWLFADVAKYDIWDFELQLYEDGDIMRVKDKRDSLVETRRFKKSFSNYFGVGIDARTGYTFDKHRTRSVLMNLICYGCIGFMKFFKKTRKVEQFVENMEFEEVEASQGTEKKIVFHTNKDYYGQENSLKRGYRTIVCLNSTSFMGGSRKMWSSEKRALQNSKEVVYKKQDFGDGQLEFVSYKTELHLGLEKILGGQGSRLTQGSGPFTINFKHSEQPLQTFFQLDGQYFKTHNPKKISVQKTKRIKGSQINVLVFRD